jgi:hypothetical protein
MIESLLCRNSYFIQVPILHNKTKEKLYLFPLTIILFAMSPQCFDYYNVPPIPLGCNVTLSELKMTKIFILAFFRICFCFSEFFFSSFFPNFFFFWIFFFYLMLIFFVILGHRKEHYNSNVYLGGIVKVKTLRGHCKYGSR